MLGGPVRARILFLIGLGKSTRPNDTAVQLRAGEGAKRPTRPSVCNGWLGSVAIKRTVGMRNHEYTLGTRSRGEAYFAEPYPAQVPLRLWQVADLGVPQCRTASFIPFCTTDSCR